ncbi:MAG: phosphodiester glycosidase family protein [Chloroflexi bacterium]|nr:phosphodiester glycosidase family protein [Chloroflexota bacterium]
MARLQTLSSYGGKQKQQRSRNGWKIVLLSGTLTILFALLFLLAIVPVISPSTGADVADLLRSIVGPAPVAALESTSYHFQDVFNQVRSQLSGGQSEIQWSSQPQSNTGTTAIPSTATPTAIPKTPPPAAEVPLIQNIPTAAPTAAPAPVNNVVADSPQIGWQAYGPEMNGQPIMARAMQMLDPTRSYTGVALVRIDLSRLQLHMMPGNIEPSHPSGINQAIPDLGMIPPADQSSLIAAFNGGFKGVHGRFGMMVNDFTLLPPIDGLGTAAIYQDGHVAIGTWGTDLTQTPDMIAFRQNCPPLIDAGQINPGLYLDNRKAWGYTGNSDVTWRTGLGITQDGRYLIYAVGNGTSAATLAEALQNAGAYNAMQLDINQYYAHFYTYTPASDPSQEFSMTGEPLLAEMIYNPHLYLTPNVRDFFYLTLK